MHRPLALLPVLALAACAGGHTAVTPKTRLDVEVSSGHGISRYTLTCRPAGGSAPHPGTACRALEDFLPKTRANRAACMCALYEKWIRVRGALDGRRLANLLEVSDCSACGLGVGARTDVVRAFAAFGLNPP